MDAYKVILAGSVEHDVRGIGKKNLDRIMAIVESLCLDPFPRGCKKLKASRSGHRVRVGDYRIVYEVDTEDKIITVFHIRHRKDAY